MTNLNIEGRNTITAYNSVGMPYSWDTNIRSVTEVNGKIEVIHKPKGSKTAYKHTYDKDQELRIYKGWLKINLLEESFSNNNNELECYNGSVFDVLNQYENKLLFKH